MENKQDIFVKMVLDAWHTKVNQFDKLIAELSDEQLMKEVSPGKNRGIYLLGHLTALVNFMLPLLGYAENPTPQLVEPFVKMPDKAVADLPSIPELRQEWAKAKDTIEHYIANTTPDEWFQKHTSISSEDFEKEPHRNKLNVMLSRASHLDYHIGQLIFLKTA